MTADPSAEEMRPAPDTAKADEGAACEHIWSSLTDADPERCMVCGATWGAAS